MKSFIGCLILLGVVAVGCVSKKEMQAKQQAAFLAGQQQGAAMQAHATSIWVMGNVRNPNIPYTEGLTLRQALIQANYLGQGDPNQIIVMRNGSQPTTVSSQDLLSGFDMPLMAGDRVQIR